MEEVDPTGKAQVILEAVNLHFSYECLKTPHIRIEGGGGGGEGYNIKL